MQRFGATPEAWDHFADKLGLVADLLPVVSNPNAEISDQSKMRSLGKTPSIYNRDRKVAGLSKWTAVDATPFNIQRWKSEPDYGICLQTRRVRAFDHDHEHAAEIASAIDKLLGFRLPRRCRANSNRLLQAFTYNRALTKRVVPVADGMIELLATGQQFIAAGTHPSGSLYEWQGGLPKAFPVLSAEQLDNVWAMIETMYATGDTKIARERREGSDEDLPTHDEVADWLLENWETYDVGSDGQLFIECPFADSHTTDSGPTATAYFPAGTGGYQQGHFVCLHAHCVEREDADFRGATGFELAQFADLTGSGGADSVDRSAEGEGTGQLGSGMAAAGAAPKLDPDRPFPPMVRAKSGQIEATADNMRKAISDGKMICRTIGYDAFTDDLMHCKLDTFADWNRLTDADMVDIRVELERCGFKPMSKDLLREVTHASGKINGFDSAQLWLSGLRWDGVERIERFAVDCWGWKDSEYARSVGRYVWTAMAGRVMEPGVRADMAPILVGEQGIKKTSAIQAMVPSEDHYAEVRLDDKDDDISRKLRGKLIGELEELRGLNSRAIEEIKAFVSRRRESWVPKFKEFENFFYRRCILVGSTNDYQFLADPTGERRWLPGECNIIDLERIVEERDQLWAEGAFVFAMDGVQWADAERLAEREHPRFKISDSWEHVLSSWIEEADVGGRTPLSKGHVTVHEALMRLGIPAAQANRGHELRVAKVLRHIGLREVTFVDSGRSYKGYEKA